MSSGAGVCEVEGDDGVGKDSVGMAARPFALAVCSAEGIWLAEGLFVAP